MSELGNCWYVIYTKPRHEKKVVASFEGIKLEHYLPTAKTLRITAGRKKYVTLPLFPSYVFVKPESAKHYFDSLQVPGVLQYVKTGKQIAQIAESVINKLKAIDAYGNMELTISSQQFSPGQAVNIQAGPFTGFNCEVIQYHGRHKILVRVELLQRNLLMDMPEEWLIPRC